MAKRHAWAQALPPFPIKILHLAFTLEASNSPAFKNPEHWEEVYNAAMDSAEYDSDKTKALIQLIHDDVMVIPYLEEIQVSFYQKGVHIPEMEKYGTLSYLRDESWLSPDLR